MKQTKLEQLSAQVKVFCDTGTEKQILEDQTEHLILDVLKGAYEDMEHKSDYVALLQRIRIRCDCSDSWMSQIIGSIGYSVYDKKEPKLAEMIYRIATEMYPESMASTNLAYICRHHKDELSTSDIEIIDLLLAGVKQRKAISLVNMALHFAQNLGREDDWQLADKMIGLIKDSDVSSVVGWWAGLAEENDPEGILVLCWLERHNKYTVPHSLREKFAGLRGGCSSIPQWIFDPIKQG